MDEKVDLSRIRKLRDDSPTTVMGWVRLAWPEIKAALERHVALKTIHKRLNEAGIQISYPRLSLYVGRLRREEQGKTADPSVEKAAAEIAEHRPVKDAAPAQHRDPLDNFRERTANRPGFDFPPGPPDEDELI
ncbi:MAG: hypothetical protein JO061_04405 [Acidobacteriaceae bacterium]|nr:hypothetical protein [Acidobacteriaceae bacterium]